MGLLEKDTSKVQPLASVTLGQKKKKKKGNPNGKYGGGGDCFTKKKSQTVGLLTLLLYDREKGVSARGGLGIWKP